MGKPKKVVVLLGGKSEEREVSLRTGEAVYQALLEKGYEAAKIDLDEMVVDNLRREKPDVVFIALHGKYGEDGCVQGLLEILGIPYTGCGVRASANCMHKITTKQILVAAGIPTAPYTAVTKSEIDRQGLSAVAERVKKEINIPLVIKPASQGSTIGVQFVREAERLEEGMLKALRYDDELLIEKMFSGTEITAAIMGNRDPVALPLIEIVSHTGVFDYQAKYTPGLSEHIIPARITPEQEKRAKEVAVKTY
ncbi:MAG: D-alanine--D-alanine ligase, partial [Clostridia bacterium]|nr:D-alanine--D-alanine ligase [Clostridia bacterium]